MAIKTPTAEELAELLVEMEEVLAQREISSPPAPAPEPSPEPTPAPEPAPGPTALKSGQGQENAAAEPLGNGMAFIHSPEGMALKEGLSSLIVKMVGGLLKKGGSPPEETLSKTVGTEAVDADALAREAAGSGAGIVFLITAGMSPGAAKSIQEALSRRGLTVERVDGNSLPGKAALLDILLDLKAMGF